MVFLSKAQSLRAGARAGKSFRKECEMGNAENEAPIPFFFILSAISHETRLV
ncbi:hypothetical protein [Citrobacter sp. NCU1]|uniref:hypothetical protein n=1 Tax=Citrobacter sp. NCU1 TaxID=2026683 RepID=UPI001391858B|nr:hypothetical protein [Citrobacter sp. NCU1]